MLILYDSKETAFTSNGLVVLSDALSCIIEEELNGLYECTLEYPLDERGKWKYLIESNVIKADGQLFRIYKKIKTLTSIKINARHIFYDLLDNMCEDDRLTNEDGARALEWTLDNNCQYPHPFTNTSDLGPAEHTHYYVRRNPVDIIMNATDGIIAIWGGELVRDNFSISLLQARGASNGVLISYGKNIQGIEETLDLDTLCTRLMPVGKKSANGTGADGLLLPEKYLDSPYLSIYPSPKIKIQKFDDIEIQAEANLFDKETVSSGYDVNSVTGLLVAHAIYFASDFIQVDPSTEYEKDNPNTVVFYDMSHAYISGLSSATTFMTPSNCYSIKYTDLLDNLNTSKVALSYSQREILAINRKRLINRCMVNML